MNYRNRALLDLAKGMACQNCGAEDGTIVAAHSNMSIHGKGGQIKSHDCFHAWLCYRCHTWLDQGGIGRDPTGRWSPSRDNKVEMFRRAMERTWLEMWQQGLISNSPRRP